ncbi:hypothetical protein [Pajaroellobacter abortibovis]|uniref:Uncharacterized protein n=1 Tax=Pajaroellobacter abortibovis TaxID=1882918 RepID=A0A1L6MXM9_9BACT|nr:hypothetical protein [Pajaroellobacter abortibovis]APS00260.1 hypothetical protein BCY86_05850 [Pajaroellobacter abortibovis]
MKRVSRIPSKRVAPSVESKTDSTRRFPSRHEVLLRLGKTAGMVAGGTLIGRLMEKGGKGVKPSLERRVRDYRVKSPQQKPVQLAIARRGIGLPVSIEDLVQRAIDALGGMHQFVSRGDIVVIKPNIG